MDTLTLPIILQKPRLIVAELSPDPAIDLATDDLQAQIQTSYRHVIGVQVGMVCGGAPAAGTTGRLRVGAALHPTADDVIEAAQYHGLSARSAQVSATAGATIGWLIGAGASDLWPAINAAASGGQRQNGGIFEAGFAGLAEGGAGYRDAASCPLRPRFINLDWRKGDLTAGCTLTRLTVWIHCQD